jgi:hypothetical protein
MPSVSVSGTVGSGALGEACVATFGGDGGAASCAGADESADAPAGLNDTGVAPELGK